jgi:hypothetical protein
MGKLRTEGWEFARAEYFASLTKQVMTEGASGGEEVEPLLTAALYDGADAAATAAKVRAAAYATFRALERGAPWTALALAVGWSAYNQPEWRIDPFGYVELRGAVAGGSGTIATLPAGSWPTRSDQFLVGASGGAGTAQLSISTGGVLTLSTLGTGASAAYITLAGVRWHLT